MTPGRENLFDAFARTDDLPPLVIVGPGRAALAAAGLHAPESAVFVGGVILLVNWVAG